MQNLSTNTATAVIIFLYCVGGQFHHAASSSSSYAPNAPTFNHNRNNYHVPSPNTAPTAPNASFNLPANAQHYDRSVHEDILFATTAHEVFLTPEVEGLLLLTFKLRMTGSLLHYLSQVQLELRALQPNQPVQNEEGSDDINDDQPLEKRPVAMHFDNIPHHLGNPITGGGGRKYRCCYIKKNNCKHKKLIYDDGNIVTVGEHTEQCFVDAGLTKPTPVPGPTGMPPMLRKTLS